MTFRSPIWKLAIVVAACSVAGGDDTKPAKPIVGNSPLGGLQEFIGQWKGVGQVRRGSNQGAWIEQAAWAWKFGDDAPAITFAAPMGKQLVEGRITAAGDGAYSLHAKTASAVEATYSGKRHAEAGHVVFTRAVDSETPPTSAGPPDRVTLRLAAEGSRMVVLLERRTGVGDTMARIAEIAYTREGSEFGKGGGGPECIVTGGAGTIAVAHAGKTYYVCCTGCKELFEAEAEKVIAEYKARKDLK